MRAVSKAVGGLLAAGVVVLLVLAPAAAVAAEQRASLIEIEKQVMCPVCGTLLQLAESPQAMREKAFIRRLIDEGRTEAQIKDALVAEYGNEVLALPQGSGFSLSAYVVPIVAFVLAAIALAIGVLRWRRAGDRKGRGSPEPGPSDEDSKRLDADLARYDL